MDKLLNFTICSGMRIQSQHQKAKILDLIPDSCFGVFVTIRRTHEYYEPYKRKIKTHGCHGYWTNDYEEMSKEEIFLKLQQVSYQSTSNKDKRKSRFKMPIHRDMGANYEVNFMMKPIIDIDTETAQMSNGDKFNNVEYGLIFVNDSGRRATYLPRTWIKKSWTEIKEMLIRKSKSNSNGKFYAYKTISYKSNVFKTLSRRNAVELTRRPK